MNTSISLIPFVHYIKDTSKNEKRKNNELLRGDFTDYRRLYWLDHIAFLLLFHLVLSIFQK